MTTFKEGDKVKFKKSVKEDYANDRYIFASKGDKGVVIDVDDENFETEYHVKVSGGVVLNCFADWLELVEESEKPSGKIKSDGGSSSYYDLPISDKLLEALNKRKEDGQCYVKTEELIQELFDNDFDFGTLFKSTVRGHLQTKGEGKAGNDLEYEINKVIYYANKIKEKGCE